LQLLHYSFAELSLAVSVSVLASVVVVERAENKVAPIVELRALHSVSTLAVERAEISLWAMVVLRA
jgi:hypothetical protein